MTNGRAGMMRFSRGFMLFAGACMRVRILGRVGAPVAVMLFSVSLASMLHTRPVCLHMGDRPHSSTFTHFVACSPASYACLHRQATHRARRAACGVIAAGSAHTHTPQQLYCESVVVFVSALDTHQRDSPACAAASIWGVKSCLRAACAAKHRFGAQTMGI